MLNDLLKGYDKHDYVYIIEGCMNLYVSDEPCTYETCEICGDSDWPYLDGYVSDILKAKDEDDLEKIQERRRTLERAKLNIEGNLDKPMVRSLKPRNKV